jgi:hypothetical protein
MATNENWIHRAAGMVAQFESMDKGRTLSIDFTTAYPLPNTADAWIVLVDAQETDRGEYWWPVKSYFAVTGTEAQHTTDDATDEQIAQFNLLEEK